MDGSYKARRDSIEKCYKAAKTRGFHIFAVQDGGWCASSATAGKTFNKYGKSSACKSDGKGGPWANQVYYIRGELNPCPTIKLLFRNLSSRKSILKSSCSV